MKRALVKIGDLGRVVTGKTPPTKQRVFFGGEHPFITPSDLDYDSYYVARTETTVTDNAKAKFPNQFIPADAITYTCIASVGKIGIAERESLTNQQINSIVTGSHHDSKFVYYLLRNETQRIQARCGGVATPIINKSDFEKIEVHVPAELADEHRIASILSAYDDLIENNRRRMRLLEEAARQLYREWFVRLRFPGHEGVKNKDGLPEGWERRRISEFGEVITGKTPSTKDNDNYGGDIPFVKTPDMHGNVFVISTETTITEKGALTQPRKFIPKHSILVSCIGTVGVVSITSVRSQFNQQINAVVPFEASYLYFCFFALKDIKERMEAIGGGATMGNVNKTKFEGLYIIKPTVFLLHKYHGFCSPLFEQLEVLQRQNRKLRAARDLLLPKLMSGEVSV